MLPVTCLMLVRRLLVDMGKSLRFESEALERPPWGPEELPILWPPGPNTAIPSIFLKAPQTDTLAFKKKHIYIYIYSTLFLESYVYVAFSLDHQSQKRKQLESEAPGSLSALNPTATRAGLHNRWAVLDQGLLRDQLLHLLCVWLSLVRLLSSGPFVWSTARNWNQVHPDTCC